MSNFEDTMDRIEKDLEQFRRRLDVQEKQFLEQHNPDSLKDTVSLNRIMLDILEVLYYPYRRLPNSSDKKGFPEEKISEESEVK